MGTADATPGLGRCTCGGDFRVGQLVDSLTGWVSGAAFVAKLTFAAEKWHRFVRRRDLMFRSDGSNVALTPLRRGA